MPRVHCWGCNLVQRAMRNYITQARGHEFNCHKFHIMAARSCAKCFLQFFAVGVLFKDPAAIERMSGCGIYDTSFWALVRHLTVIGGDRRYLTSCQLHGYSYLGILHCLVGRSVLSLWLSFLVWSSRLPQNPEASSRLALGYINHTTILFIFIIPLTA
jgi:hypothetical protein